MQDEGGGRGKSEKQGILQEVQLFDAKGLDFILKVIENALQDFKQGRDIIQFVFQNKDWIYGMETEWETKSGGKKTSEVAV